MEEIGGDVPDNMEELSVDVPSDENELKVDVSPDMGMYRIIPQQGYDPAFALSEFIDNSLHAFIHYGKELPNKILTIKLNIYTNSYEKDVSKRNSIEIIDDGPGMRGEDLARAFKPAKKPVVEGLSEFGIGMKAAAVWFTQTWLLTTKSFNDNFCHIVDFDLNKLLEEGRSTIVVQDSSSNINIPSHGTFICLKDLRSRRCLDSERARKVIDILNEIYQRYTDIKNKGFLVLKASIDGGQAIVAPYIAHADNAVLVSPFNKSVIRQKKETYYAIGEEKKWEKSINFEFSHEGGTSKVTGFIRILKVGRYGTENPGLVLFRNNRVIIGTHSKEFKPVRLYGSNNKFRSQRLYGELSIDGLPVTYTKDGIDFDEDSFIEAMMIDPDIELYCKQCDNHRADKEKSAIVYIDSEDDIPASANTKNAEKEKGNTEGGKGNSGPKVNQKPKSKRQKIIDYLNVLNNSDLANLGISSFISEIKYQLVSERPLSVALNLRVVAEKGILFRIKKDHPNLYQKFFEWGIQNMVNYMSNKQNGIFDSSPLGLSAFKYCEINSKGQNYGDVFILNNIGHGNVITSMDAVEEIISNMQALLDWCYQ